MRNHLEIPVKRILELYTYNEWTGDFTRKSDGLVPGYWWKNKYIRVYVDETSYKAHRCAWAICCYEPGDLVVDHINQHRGDNSIENLQAITKEENSALAVARTQQDLR